MSTTTQTIKVSGMTCDHCVNAVRGELSKLDGVREVEVSLDSGQVVITSDAALDADTVRSAVDEAGYEVTS